MPSIRSTLTSTTAGLLAVLLLASLRPGEAPAAAPTAPPPLMREEADGYLQWLHSLEQTVAARQARGLDEAPPLYPFDLQPLPAGEENPHRHLAVARAVADAERNSGHGSGGGAGHALSMARNYLGLAEWDSALVWFDRAAARDTSGAFRAEVRREALAAAVALGDSVVLAARLAATAATEGVTGREREIVIAVRHATGSGDDHLLDRLLANLDAHDAELGDHLRYWYAFGLAARARRDDALAQLRLLMAGGGLSRDLAEDQRTWALTAMPDLFFLLGDHRTARELYGVLAHCGLERARLHAEFHLACLDLTEARFDRAAERLLRLAEVRVEGPWSTASGELAATARELARIRKEGEPYGTAPFYGR
ncbi:MAG: hypothetical protein R6X25_08835 [Candidatus Krumholzibacteriia bacterium]